MDKELLIETLLEKPCFVIDILPYQVPKQNSDFFFNVEQYFFNTSQLDCIAEKFVHIVLKTLCYFEFSLYSENWLEETEPHKIAAHIKGVVTKKKGSFSVLLPKEQVLLKIDGGDLYLTVYNCSGKVEDILKALAISEGFFWRKGSS